MAAPSVLPAPTRSRPMHGTRSASPMAGRLAKTRRACAKVARAKCIWPMCAIPTATSFAACTGCSDRSRAGRRRIAGRRPLAHGRCCMIPWVQLGTASVPGGGELKLMQRGQEFSIMSGTIALMNSRMSGSEEALADFSCGRIAGRRNCRILIGGYGMGFTLRTALAGLGPDAKIVVAELVPGGLAWAGGPLAHLTANSPKEKGVQI